MLSTQAFAPRHLHWPNVVLIVLVILAVLLSFSSSPTSAQQKPPTQSEAQPQLVVGIGHRMNVMAVAISPDGLTVASGGLDKTVKLWDAQTGGLKQTISGFRDLIDHIEFAPDGKTLKVRGNDGGNGGDSIYDFQTGALTLTGSPTPVDKIPQSPCPSGYLDEAGRSPNGKLAVCRILRPEEREKEYKSPNAYFLELWDVQANQMKSQLDSQVPLYSHVVFSPDSRMIITYNDDYKPGIRLWETQTGQRLKDVEGHFFEKFLPDGQTIVLRNNSKGQSELWDARLETQKFILSGGNRGLIVSPNHEIIAAQTTETKIVLLDAKLWTIKSELNGAARVINFSFSNDGTTLTGLTETGIAQSWEVQTGKLKQTLSAAGQIKPNDSVPSIELPPDDPSKKGIVFFTNVISLDGKTLAATLNRSVVIWNLRTNQIRQTQIFDSPDKSAVFANDGKTLFEAIGDNSPFNKADPLVIRWNLQTTRPRVISKSELKSLTASSTNPKALSPDGRTTVKVNQTMLSAQLFDAKTGKPLGHSFKHGDPVSSYAFTPDGKFLLSVSGELEHGSNLNALVIGHKTVPKAKGGQGIFDNPEPIKEKSVSKDTIKLWDVHTGRLQRTIYCESNVKGLVVMPEVARIVTIHEIYDESKMAVSFKKSINTIKVWDVISGKLVKTIQRAYLELSPDGRMALSSGQASNSVDVLDTLSGEIKWTLLGTSVDIFSPSFSPDGRLILTTTSSADGISEIKLWNAQTGKLKSTIADKGGFKSFSPDGKLLFASSGEKKNAWDIETGKQIWNLQMQNPLISDGFFSPDGRLMAVTDDDNTVKIRETSTGRTLLTLVTFQTKTPNRIEWVAFTLEGYYSASIGATKYMSWRVGEKLLPAEAYAKEFNRPDLVQKALQNR